MGYIIDLFGELTEVKLSFFSMIEIVRHDKIGSVHFINVGFLRGFGDSSYTFSITDTTWQQVQTDLRNKKIDDILL